MINTMMEIVKLKAGGQQVVRLKGLTMAGFEWVYENSNEKVASVQKAFEAEPAVTKTIGASATETFTITALQKGEATLRFRQVRQWEPGKPPRDEKLVKLLVD
jgi:predicted secreted protein